MDIKDFQGISYFRFLVPVIYILSWLAMIIGPQTSSILYREYCMALTIFLTGKAFYQVILNMILIIKGNAVLKRSMEGKEKMVNPFLDGYKEIYHAFAIPSYNQDLQILSDTLNVLSQHKRARQTYLIFLAMQKHERDSDRKAEQLIERFGSKFRYMDYTVHEMRPNEQKGKASNVSWCVQHMQEKFNRLMINTDDVFVTVIDADSWAPNCYFDQVQNHMFGNFGDRYDFIYQPTQIYTRNNMDVPMIVRTYDDMYSSLHASNQVTCSGITFSFSNYTLSYNLLKKIGFWDTIEEAIAQDYHMCLKSHFKTEGKVKFIPIFSPFNQLCVQTGKGKMADFKAKFTQIERHARVVSDIGYCVLMFVKNGFSLKSLYLVFAVIQMILMPIIIPWTLVSNVIFDQILHVQAPEGFLDPKNCVILWNFSSFFMLTSCFMFQYYKRRCSKILYGIQNPHFLRSLQTPIFSTINLLTLMTPAYILGSFGNLKRNRSYNVAQKSSCKTPISVKIQKITEQEKNELLTQ